MTSNKNSLFRSASLLVSGCIILLGALFITITYLSTLHYYQATTQRLNKDVASHIATFTSPFEPRGLNRKIADSIFYEAMILSPSVEVYFLDTTGTVLYFHAPDSAIKGWHISLAPIRTYIADKGLDYIKGPDPKWPGKDKIFSAAEVISNGQKRGYIYVILGGNDYQNVSQLLFGNHVTTLALQASGIVLVLSIFISLLYFNRIKKNLRKVTEVLEAYRKGNYKARFSSDSYTEFTPVADSFNQMADLLTLNIQRLEQAEKERRDFLANISHDLRTPLTVIRGYVETLREESNNGRPDVQRQASITALINKKLEQLQWMILQLFELSKMESTHFKPCREPFNFAELIEEIITGSRNLAILKNIQLSSSGSQEMAWINADIALLERAIQNLFDNAIGHTPENGVVSVTLEKQRDGVFRLIIANTCPSLPEELLQWINREEVNPERPALVRKGLGLAIIKKIAQLHNYQLRAESTATGVRFTLCADAYVEGTL
jgi:signal transduction histidine kinase